jgi:XTP/dITP diphosphohydrolase
MELLLGTNNAGKIVEMREVLSDLPIKLFTVNDLNVASEPDEYGKTFTENALIKARHFYELALKPTVADDSGIIVEALKDELGIATRRWGAGAKASDEEWITYFLKRMESEQNKRAQFVCSIAFVDANGTEVTFEGTCDGVITQTLEAGYLKGLPISACFKPDGFDCVYSAMTVEQKNSTSHRGRALRKFRDHLIKLNN